VNGNSSGNVGLNNGNAINNSGYGILQKNTSKQITTIKIQPPIVEQEGKSDD